MQKDRKVVVSNSCGNNYNSFVQLVYVIIYCTWEIGGGSMESYVSNVLVLYEVGGGSTYIKVPNIITFVVSKSSLCKYLNIVNHA